MAYHIKNQFALKASNEYILIDHISKRGFFDKSVRDLTCCKVKVKGNLIFDQKQSPQEYHLIINRKIVPYNDLDKILDRTAGEISDLALIFKNTIGLEPGEKCKFSFSGKGSKLMGKLVVQPLNEEITIPQSSEIGEDVSVVETAKTGLINQPPPSIPIEIREKNMKILKEAYENYLNGNYPFKTVEKDADIEEAYNNKKIFVIKKNMSNDAVVVGQEGFYYIRKGEEYYYPWPEIKNIAWGTIPKKHKVRRGVINITFWNDSYFRFLPGKYDQSEFAVNITITTSMKILKMYEKLFRKYWKPDFTFKESFPRM